MKKILLSLVLLASLTPTTQAQDFSFDPLAWLGLDEVLRGSANQLNASANDGMQYLGAYMRPFGESITVGMNNGWYRTAATHEQWGFDISSDINFVYLPESLTSFEVSSLNLQQFETDATTLPTLIGGSADSAMFNLNYQYNGDTYELTRFKAFDGLDANGFRDSINLKRWFLPVPTFNATLGIGFGTDVSLRFMGIPPSPFRSFNAFAWGVGVKHDFTQWIPGMKEFPMDLTAFVGYTNSRFRISVTPAGVANIASFTIGGHALTTQVLASKKLGAFTPYLGLGYDLAASNTYLRGGFSVPTYTFDPSNPSNPIQEEELLELGNLDPVKYRTSGARATLGARLQVWAFSIHADYTFASNGYQMFTLGSGISWK